MASRVSIDRQGRVVIPQRERERLNLMEGEVLDLLPTPEGVLLERRRRARVSHDADGLPLVTFEERQPVSNEDALAAIRAVRARE